MVIGIIGAGLAGLTAGKLLAEAGHDVTVIEKRRMPGGKLATVELDGTPLDYGISHLGGAGAEAYLDFINGMVQENVLQPWEEEFALYDSEELLPVNPNKTDRSYYCAPGGIRAVAEKLGRPVDIKSGEKAGGLTYIGAGRSQKKAWMINLTDISVFECDAVIIAAPAPEAYGVLQTSQDETPARRIISHIDEIRYSPCYALAAIFDCDTPSWKGIECEDEVLAWIGNESTKRDTGGRTALLLRSTPSFAREYAERAQPERIKSRMIERASEITGESLVPAGEGASYLHFWKYFEAENPIDEYFMEMEMEDAPLALIGDYLHGTTGGDAFMSGYNLARYWINKFSAVTA